MAPSARELAHELVETLAPDELPTFALVAEPYLGDPRRAEKRLRDHDDPMGFGLGHALAISGSWTVAEVRDLAKFINGM